MADLDEPGSTVARLPILSKQVEHGISMAEELSEMASMFSNSLGAGSAALSKDLKKRRKQLDRLLGDTNISMVVALAQMRDNLQTQAGSWERFSKQFESEIASVVEKLAEFKLKQKSEMDLELFNKKKSMDNAKAAIVKKRKECLKAWDSLQADIRKVISYRESLSKEVREDKREKCQKTVDRYEASVFKNKTSVRMMFSDLENLVEQTNTQIKAFYDEESPNYCKQLSSLDLECNNSMRSVLQSYIATQKELIAEMTRDLTSLEDAVGRISPEKDITRYNDIPAPSDTDTSLLFVSAELPCPSYVVENGADAILKAGIQAYNNLSTDLIINDLGGDNSSKIEQKEYENSTIYPSNDGKIRAMSIYAFDGEMDPSYLTFHENEMIVVTDQSDAVWWGGYLESDPQMEEKWFPSEYVNLIE